MIEQGNGPQVLIVDDDALTTAWLRELFVRAGYSVQVASTGAEALARVRENPPAVVILDLVLPDLDGLEVCRRIRLQQREALSRIVILSARNQPDEIVRGLEAGADDYISKRPGADVELLGKVQALVARAQAKPAHTGKIISLFSAKGGSGTTTLAANLALALERAEPTASILLVDLVLPLGSIGHLLNCESDKNLARLSHALHQGRASPELVAPFISRNGRYGFSVLLSANDLQQAQSLEVNRIGPIFQTLRGMYDYIVVDFGRSLSRVSIPVLEMSSLVLVIVTPDVTAVALTRTSLNYLASLALDPGVVAVVQNRTGARSWLGREDIEKQLGRPIALTIPYDGEQVTLSMNAGELYLARHPDSIVSTSLRDLARLVLKRTGMPASAAA